MKQQQAVVILAGGRSQRMGRSKALMPYQKQTLLHVLFNRYQTMAIGDVFVSGDYPAYPCITDPSPYQGPAKAIMHCAQCLSKQGYEKAVFVPVDMPCLSKEVLTKLLATKGHGYFSQQYLPLGLNLCRFEVGGEVASVKALLNQLQATPLKITNSDVFLNVNTPQQWQDFLDAH